MKPIIRKIDRALKTLYNLELSHKAEDFVINNPEVSNMKVGSPSHQGALIVNQPESEEVQVGIYLAPEIAAQLTRLTVKPPHQWTTEEFNAFSVAAEEVSHLNYLLFHALGGRQVSQLELEVQGEIDKFLLSFYYIGAGKKLSARLFDSVFDLMFSSFHWAPRLEPEERTRYSLANTLAYRFLLRERERISSLPLQEEWLRTLRRFYRLNASEKFSWIGH